MGHETNFNSGTNYCNRLHHSNALLSIQGCPSYKISLLYRDQTSRCISKNFHSRLHDHSESLSCILVCPWVFQRQLFFPKRVRVLQKLDRVWKCTVVQLLFLGPCLNSLIHCCAGQVWQPTHRFRWLRLGNHFVVSWLLEK